MTGSATGVLAAGAHAAPRPEPALVEACRRTTPAAELASCVAAAALDLVRGEGAGRVPTVGGDREAPLAIHPSRDDTSPGRPALRLTS